MKLRVRLTGDVLSEIETFLTECGAAGAEGAGLVACQAADAGGWVSVRFIAPDQHAYVGDLGCSVEVTEVGKVQLVQALGRGEMHLVRVHSHPGRAFHSPVDDRNPALTHEGALSVVVPYFGLGLHRGLDACAVFRLEGGRWRERSLGETEMSEAAMPEINTVAELLDQLGDVATAPESLADLQARGVTFAPDLQARLAAAPGRTRLSAAERRRLAALAGRLGPVQLTATGVAPLMADALPQGEYDLVVALRLAVLNETLAALFEGMAYPREIVDDVDALFTRERLVALSDDIPPNIPIGPLRLTAPLTVYAVDGTENLLLVQEFSLDFRQTILQGPLPGEITVSSLVATAQFGVAVRPGVQGDELILNLADIVFPVTDTEQLRLTVAPDSPIQPRSAEALEGFAAEIDGLFRVAVRVAVAGAVDSVSPIIHLPFGVGADLTVHDIGVRTHSDDDDVIVVGVRLATDALPVEGLGNPDTLSNPFGATTLNTYARFHEALFRKVVKEAHASGALEDAARGVHGDLRVDGADAQLDANELQLILDIRLVNACGFIVNTIDVNVRVTVTFHFAVFQGQLFVTRTADHNIDNTDVVLCVVTELLQLATLGAAFSLIELILQLMRLAPLISTDEDREPVEIFPAVFDPTEPVPGTEVLPRVEAVQALVSEDRVESLGTLSLRPDDVNTYVYVQFKRRSAHIGEAPTPITGARVDILDQDQPIPPDDDASLPQTGTTSTIFGHTITDTTVRFVAPDRDQVLASGTTDGHGRVQFVLRPNQLETAAGSVETTVSTENVENEGRSKPQKTTTRPLRERLPDIYFRVTQRDGGIINSRQLDEGFVPNLNSRRVGSAREPLTFLTGTQGPGMHQ